MSRKKAESRSYANPVIVSMSFTDGKEVKVEVSEYQVTDKHVILTRKEGDSKLVKYVSLAVLARFEFDSPADYQPKMVLAQNYPPYANLPASIVNVGDNGAPIFEPNPIVARAPRRPVAVPRPAPDVEVSTSEKKVIETAMTGAGIAGMS